MHKHGEMNEKVTWLHYSIIEAESGKVVFQFENNFKRQGLRCLGFFTFLEKLQPDFSGFNLGTKKEEPTDLWMAFFFVKCPNNN